MFLQNIDICLQVMALHAGRPTLMFSPLWEPQPHVVYLSHLVIKCLLVGHRIFRQKLYNLKLMNISFYLFGSSGGGGVNWMEWNTIAYAETNKYICHHVWITSSVLQVHWFFLNHLICLIWLQEAVPEVAGDVPSSPKKRPSRKEEW